jgi:hypothetical protein
MSYTKLFSSIVTSTIWTEDDKTRIVWITMLAIANKHGEVQASIPGLARVSGVSVEAAEAAINRFLAPDQYSRTPDDEGRRIEKIEGGWQLLNHAKYRAMASKDEAIQSNAERQRRHRQKKARNAVIGQGDQCAYCGGDAAGVDHVVPTCRGGLDDPSNLVRACSRCNNFKASMNVTDFLNNPTLPFKINAESVLSNVTLSQIVTLRNGSWEIVTHNRDIAEAEAEAEAEAKRSRASKRAAASAAKSELLEILPTGAAADMLALQSRIQSIKPAWKLALTYEEQQSMMRNGACLASLEDADWQRIQRYLHARLPEGTPGWQPRSRGKFIETLPDVHDHACSWEEKNGDKPKAKGWT